MFPYGSQDLYWVGGRTELDIWLRQESREQKISTELLGINFSKAISLHLDMIWAQ